MEATVESIAQMNGHQKSSVEIGNAEPENKVREMTANIELVTPAKAKKWLDDAADNRKFSQGHSARLGRALEAEEWRVSSQGIGIDYNGRLIDGQHRLWAIANSGVGAWLVVVRGLDPDTIRAIDETRKRSFGDDLKIEGHESYAASAAFAGLVLRYEMAAARGLTLSVARTLQLGRIEQANALEEYERRCDLTYLIRTGARANKGVGIPASAVSASYYLALQHLDGSGEVDEFFGKLGDGYNIEPGEPVDALRRGAVQRRQSSTMTRLEPVGAAAAILYCLRKTIAGESLTKIQWSAVNRQTPRNLLS